MCSMRLRYHLQQHKKREQASVDAELLAVLLDNCVGQNKSNAVLQFFCLLGLLFYPKVALVFLIPGHSHMIADRVVVWCRRAIRGKNL